MSDKLVILVSVFAAILLGAYFLFSNNASAPSDESSGSLAVVEDEDTAPVEEDELEESEDTNGENTEEETAPPRTITPAPAPTPTPAPTPIVDEPYIPRFVTVVYDGDEFTPREIMVVEGATVRFVNIGDIPMWVASDNHPTHTIYDTTSLSEHCADDYIGPTPFDQCASVEKSGSWNFTFNKNGTWKYHNHMRGKDEGAIIVMPEDDYLKAVDSPIL